MRAGGHVFQAAPGGLGQHQGEGEAEYCHAGGEQQRAAQPEPVVEQREQEDADERAELADPGGDPCPVARMLTGYSSQGITKVVMFGPNSVKK